MRGASKQTDGRRALSAFAGNRRGGMAVMGAVIMLPLCMVSFAAVEFHRVTTIRSSMQSAIDAATLMAAKSGKKTSAELKTAGLPVFRHNLSRMGINDLDNDDVTFVSQTGGVVGEARLCIDTLAAGIIGVAETCISVSAEVVREATALEVVLVLDNSGSMGTNLGGGQTRIAALETAAAGFIAKLEGLDDPALPDDIRVGVVPFAGTVKLNPSNQGASWIDTAGASVNNTGLFHSVVQILTDESAGSPVAKPRRFDYFSRIHVNGSPISWAGCVESRPGDYGLSDAAPDSAKPDSLFVPYFAPDEPDQIGTNSTDPQPTPYPNDYLSDRTQEDFPVRGQNKKLNSGELKDFYDTYWKEVQYVVEKYTSTNPVRASVASKVLSNDMGPNRWCKTNPVTPLSSDWTALRGAVSSMPLARHTNIPLGLMWGWHVLSPNAPFAGGKPYGQKGVRKVIVLMTDGENLMDPPGGSGRENVPNSNQSYYNPYGYLWRSKGVDSAATTDDQLGLDMGSSEAAVSTKLNDRMRTICNRMKASTHGISVYAVQFAQGTTADANLLHCAGAENFKFANQASELDAAFQSIAEDISLLRLSR